MSAATMATTPYVPATITPPPAELSLLKALSVIRSNLIETWPLAIYEQPFFEPTILSGYLFTCDPEAIGAILLDQADAFSRGHIQQRVLNRASGGGIFSAEGAHWKWQRQAAAPIFRPDRIRTMTPIFARAAEATRTRWLAYGDGARIDVSAEMRRTTLDIILDTMMPDSADFDRAEAGQHISAFIEAILKPALIDVLRLPDWICSLFPAPAKNEGIFLRGVLDRMVSQRRAAGLGRGDLIDQLMSATDPESGRSMDDVLVRDNLLTFINAGHESTSSALTWTFYLIANHAPTEARLLEEMNAVVGQDSVRPEHIDRLVFTKQVLQEAMRLYPPAPYILREAERDVVLAGRNVKKGTQVFIPIYALHRHRLHWTDPDTFNPDRFSAENGQDKRRYIYMPFGGGPRVCIGATFAYTEALTILASLLPHIQLIPDPDHKIRPLGLGILRPEGGMPMTLKARI